MACWHRNLVLVRGTLGARVADGVEDVADLRDGFTSGDVVRRVPAGAIDGTLTGVGVGPVLRPAVLFAFVDGTCLLQHVDGPSAQRSDRRPSFFR